MSDNDFNAGRTILIAEDEVEVLEGFELMLNSEGFLNILPCTDSRKILTLLEENNAIEVILLDLLMPFMKGWEILPLICEKFPHIPVIVVTALDEIEMAVNCMKAGAFDYLVKPVEKMRLITCVKRAVEKRSVHRENMALKKQILSGSLEHPGAFESIVTRSKAMLAIFKYIEAIAPSSESVLITGETGVGKELVAQAIHKVSGLKGPFLGVNIAGVDDQSISDTLFGHKRGAFTGADKNRDGLVKKASKGTLFLDEISEMSMRSQVKLLRLVQEKEYFSLGSDLPLKSNVRILAASNQNLDTLIKAEKFRRDLYYRLKIHQIDLPPLRKRLEDLPLLVDHFIKKGCGRLNKRKCSYPEELISLLQTYVFPGNIRELESMIFDAVSGHSSGMLSLESFKKWIFKDNPNLFRDEILKKSHKNLFNEVDTLPTLKQATHQLVQEAMKRADNNQSIASRFLGISQPALSRRIKNMERGNN
ncbi:MAG: sigma-54 dependent transcriptional regulator [Desulfobacterales bacterium]|nr:sigma-54 dependent transcriptional regulator [Desulfobacterales bacterium]